MTLTQAREALVPRLQFRRATREALEGYLWLLPWFIGFLVFTLGPIIGSLYLSFTAYHPARTPEWIGLDNYITAFTRDNQFWPSLERTFYYAALLVPLGLVFSLGLALLVNQEIRGNGIYRTLYFLPTIIPIAAATLVWAWILHPQLGILNYGLKSVGIQGPSWLSADWAIPTVVLISLWTLVGGSRMIVFLAALKNVPQELYDAARIDGAGDWACFRYVTLPMITPALLFNLIVTMIAALKVFEVAYMLVVPNQGGFVTGSTGYSLYFYVVKLFDHAFNFFEMGYASALAWIFLLLVLVLVALQLRWSSAWVYYEGETK